jgi:hypothetical protein
MGNPLFAGFVEIQHEPETCAWSGKTTDGLASPSDCHNTAKLLSDEDDVKRELLIAFLRNFGIWSQIFH